MRTNNVMREVGMQETKPNKALVAVIVIALLAAAAAGAVYVFNKDNEASDTSNNQTPANSTSSNETSMTSTATRAYKDGTYSENGIYVSHGGI
jgi:predicted porin